MKPQTVTPTQHTATRHPCPECGNPGPHQHLGRGWVECGNHYRTRICGATWQLPIPIAPEDPTVERVISILDRHTSIGVIDQNNGGTVLDWETTLDIAQTLAHDTHLAGLLHRPTPGQMVREFHEAFDAAIDHDPTPALLRLRNRLIEEETSEVLKELTSADWVFVATIYSATRYVRRRLVEATVARDAMNLTALAKELADLIYVTYGTAVALGIDLDAALTAVHASNMSKLGPDGKPITDVGGKVLKGPNYKAPDLTGVVHGGAA